jgi:hypothetical protein
MSEEILDQIKAKLAEIETAKARQTEAKDQKKAVVEEVQASILETSYELGALFKKDKKTFRGNFKKDAKSRYGVSYRVVAECMELHAYRKRIDEKVRQSEGAAPSSRREALRVIAEMKAEEEKQRRIEQGLPPEEDDETSTEEGAVEHTDLQTAIQSDDPEWVLDCVFKWEKDKIKNLFGKFQVRLRQLDIQTEEPTPLVTSLEAPGKLRRA